jgi:hypothetical protein
MASALEEQNRLAKREQETRQAELTIARADAEARLLEAEAIKERNLLQTEESEQRKLLLASCKRLQVLVAELVDRMEDALEHSVVMDTLRIMQRDIRDLLGILSSLTVAISGALNDEDPAVLRQSLRDTQAKVLEILGRSVEGGSVEFTNIHTERDANIDVEGGTG